MRDAVVDPDPVPGVEPASESESASASASEMAPIKDKARTQKGSKMKDTFTHEDLDVYRRAIDFVVVADKVAILLERGRGYLADQLRRASTSIAFNIAEGAGEYNRREKSRFYRIAKRSTTECAAILDVCVRLELSDAEIIEEGRELLLRIVAMLTRLIRSGSDSNASTNAVPA